MASRVVVAIRSTSSMVRSLVGIGSMTCAFCFSNPTPLERYWRKTHLDLDGTRLKGPILEMEHMGVVLHHDGHNWHPSLHGQVEGAFLERQ